MTEKLRVIELTDEQKIQHVEREIDALIGLDFGTEAVEDAVAAVMGGCMWLISRLRKELAAAKPRTVVPILDHETIGFKYWKCNNCGAFVKDHHHHCWDCGARLDWSGVAP